MGTDQVIPVEDVGEVDAVVLEPGRVEDAMAVDRRQILAGFAVDVEFDRHRPPLAALDDAQRHRLLGGRDRMDGAVGRRTVVTGAFDVSDRDHPAAGGASEVEAGCRVRGVLDQHLAA